MNISVIQIRKNWKLL